MAIETAAPSTALITNDIVLFGLIAATLGAVFWTASRETGVWKKFYTYVPALLLCYFIPGIYNSFGLIDGNASKLYNPVASRVLLPAALVLLTLTIDLKGVLRLGWKLLVMYAGASITVMLGAFVAFWVVGLLHPETVAGDTWAGMATLAGSWIGGGANMVAMKELFEVDETTFGQFVVVDVGVGYVWMAVLIFLAGRAEKIDARSGADTRAIEDLKQRLAAYQQQHERVTSLTDLMVILGIAFGAVGLSHAIAGPASAWFATNVSWSQQVSLHEPFVWVVVLSTLIGLGLSFTRARAGWRRRFQGWHAAALHPDRLHRHADGHQGAGRPALAVRARPDLDLGAHRVVVATGQGIAGAFLLFRHGLAEQYRRACIGAGGGVGVPSVACAGGCVARRAGLCDRYSGGLYRRDHVESDGRGMSV